jgi:WD40 repeat protein
MGTIQSISTLEPFRNYKIPAGVLPAIEWIEDTKCLAYATYSQLTVVEVFKNTSTSANVSSSNIGKLEWVGSRQQLLALSGMELSFIDITDLNNKSSLQLDSSYRSFVVCQSIDKFALVTEHSVKVMDFERNVMSTSVLPGNITNACYLETRPVLALSRSGGVSLFDLPSSREIQSKRTKGRIEAVDYNSHLDLLACPCSDRSIKLYNPTSGKIVKTLHNLPDSSTKVKWLTDSLLGLSRANGDLIIFDIEADQLVLHKRYNSPSTSFAIHNTLNLLATTGSRGNKIKCWDLRTH